MTRNVPTSQPTFDELLRDPYEQFDKRSELLVSILEYLAAPSATATVLSTSFGRQPAWLFMPSSTTGAPTAA